MPIRLSNEQARALATVFGITTASLKLLPLAFLRRAAASKGRITQKDLAGLPQRSTVAQGQSTTGKSSWVDYVEWVPGQNASQPAIGSIVIRTGGRTYVWPGIAFGIYLNMTQEGLSPTPENAPVGSGTGTGSVMWREGLLRGATQQFGREDPKFRRIATQIQLAKTKAQLQQNPQILERALAENNIQSALLRLKPFV